MASTSAAGAGIGLGSDGRPVIGIIGGSGVYDIPGLTDIGWRRISSPFGAPSDELMFGRLGDVQLVFLPRHGRGHVHAPSDLNYRANVDAMKRAGVTEILSVSAVGSLKEDLPPIRRFLNRLLALPIAVQNTLFGVFEEIVETRVEAARAAGTLDVGAETITADSLKLMDAHVLRVDRKTES